MKILSNFMKYRGLTLKHVTINCCVFVNRSESFHGSSSFDASYKSIEDLEDFEHLPLINKRNQTYSVYFTLFRTHHLHVKIFILRNI